MTKGFSCPYHGIKAAFFFENIREIGIYLLNLVIVMTIVWALLILTSFLKLLPLLAQRQSALPIER